MHVTYFDGYQEDALKTAIFHDKKIPPLVYCALKLAGESGEVAEKIGKLFRDKDGVVDDQLRLDIILELGDILWYIAAMSDILNANLSTVAGRNLEKLASRAERGVIGGDGDSR